MTIINGKSIIYEWNIRKQSNRSVVVGAAAALHGKNKVLHHLRWDQYCFIENFRSYKHESNLLLASNCTVHFEKLVLSILAFLWKKKRSHSYNDYTNNTHTHIGSDRQIHKNVLHSFWCNIYRLDVTSKIESFPRSFWAAPAIRSSQQDQPYITVDGCLCASIFVLFLFETFVEIISETRSRVYTLRIYPE